MEKIWLAQYQPGVPDEINPDCYASLRELFLEAAQRYSDQTAFSNFNVPITYGGVIQQAEAMAGFLQHELKLAKGERVAVVMPNVLQTPVVIIGCLLAGLVVVNINPLYTAYELSNQLNDAKASTVIVLENFAHTVQKALPDTAVQHVIVSKLSDLFPWPKRWVANFLLKYVKKVIPAWRLPHYYPLRQALVLGKKHGYQAVDLNGDDLAFLQYTGGTTGTPKGAMLTHRNLIANVEQVYAWINPILREGKETIITALPLYHVFGLTANFLTFFKSGGHNVLITNPRDTDDFIAQLAKTPYTVLTGVNSLFNALLQHSHFTQLDFSQVKFILGGGMAIQQDVAERWQQVTGRWLFEGYGLTEASPVVTIANTNIHQYTGSIGLPIPSTEVKIIDEQNNTMSLGEVGELCVRGPQIMSGYWYSEQETTKVLSADGWLKTGDLAKIDQQGYVYIIDRKKDVIIVSGFNVYPSEVEKVLCDHPGVYEAGVVGVPIERYGEIVKAFIVKNDQRLNKQEVVAHCRQHLTTYKVPREIVFVDELPKTAVGKILRRGLRE